VLDTVFIRLLVAIACEPHEMLSKINVSRI